jgi:hypothetical protein
LIQLHGTALAADEGDHTEGAAIVAAILHFEIWPCAFVGGVEDRRSEKFGMSENVGNEN